MLSSLSPIELLPTELLLLVFHGLTDDARQLCSVRSVCRRWNQLAADDLLWRVAYARRGWLLPASSANHARESDFWRLAYRHAGVRVACLVTHGYRGVDRRFWDRLEWLLPRGSRLSVVDLTNTALARDLHQFDAVFLFSGNKFFDTPDKLGDALAQYVDSGGGVVLSGFAVCTYCPRGAWATSISPESSTCRSEYCPIVCCQSVRSGRACIDSESVACDHPLLRGVGRLERQMPPVPWRDRLPFGSGEAANGCTVLARWDNGHTLVVERPPTAEKGCVVSLNLDPTVSWDSGDAVVLVSNALQYVRKPLRFTDGQ
ncbi:F-box protein [uncultured virus]|nr:F-box protein [uncultured virus]